MARNAKLLVALIAILSAGAVFAWSQVILGFLRFYDLYQTIFRYQDCIVPNPVTTPCFYGAIGFVVALVWAIVLLRRSELQRDAVRWLTGFLILCVLFGVGNVAKEFYQYYSTTSGLVFGCSGLLANPWDSPCLRGVLFYFGGLFLSICILIFGVFSRPVDKSFGK